MSTGIEQIAEKRAKHVAKGWSADHDDQHRYGELSIAAAELAVKDTDAKIEHPDGWDDPWGLVKGHPDRVERLAIAGALLAAEIDRELRLRRRRDEPDPRLLDTTLPYGTVKRRPGDDR